MKAESSLSIEEFARRYGISRALAYRLAREQAIPAIRLGKRLVVPADALERWVAKESRPLTTKVESGAA